MDFQLRQRMMSFRHALVGIGTVFRTQANAWVHAFATLAVCAAGWFFGVSGSDWCWLVVAMAWVWVAECFNTAFEFLANVVSLEFHPMIKKAKDIAAGAVLVSAIGSVIIGALVFWPHFSEERQEVVAPLIEGVSEKVVESSAAAGR